MQFHRYIPALMLCLLSFSLGAQPNYNLHEVTISSSRSADTVFGTWKFSVSDYEFLGDRMILLAYGKDLSDARIVLIDKYAKVLSTFRLPDEAKKLYRDYQDFINVICSDHIYRIIVQNDVLHLGSLPVDEYRKFIMPCVDSSGHDTYFSNYQSDYPEFSYFAYNDADSSISTLRTVADEEYLHGYKMEYYFLKTRERVQATKIAKEYGIDKFRVAAAMSGYTSSMYYKPLYSPLFVMNDTVVVFDHCANAILKYNRHYELVDSLPVTYNHPKAWREWKNKVLVDEITNQAYAVYQKGGYYSLKHIDLKTGKTDYSYKLLNQYVENLKVRDGYVYYVYSPFESLQEFFVYRELIRKD